MQRDESNASGFDLRLLLGLALILVYALPPFFPYPGAWISPATPETPLWERIFPNVPTWWVLGRLTALFIGAALIGWGCRSSIVEMPEAADRTDDSLQPWALKAALAAALLQIACLPFLRLLPGFAKSLYLLWIIVPAAIVAAGRKPQPFHLPPLSPAARRAALITAATIAIWAIVRLAASWHSPIVADCVDMFRTLGGLVRFARTDADFLRESMGVTEGVGDIEVVGVNAVQLFFEGLPLLRMFGIVPCMWWMQVFNVMWIGLAGGIVAAASATLIGVWSAPIAAAAFLFSPFILMCQFLPIPTVCFPLAALLVFLPLRIQQTGSPLALVWLGAVAGLTATLPSQSAMTGFVLLFVAWRWRRGPRLSLTAMTIAILSFIAMSAPNIPSVEALRLAYNWYVTKSWPMVVGEATQQAQISPSIADWTRVDPPSTATLALSTLLSPFAIPRNSLRNLGDVLYEPLSAALALVGMLIALRYYRRAGPLYVLGLLAMGLIPGFISSYDRPSITRFYGSTLPLAILAAAGFRQLLAAARRPEASAGAVPAMTAAIALSGCLIFDFINPRILSQSTFGILMRAVEVDQLDRTAMLTAYGNANNSGNVSYNDRLWEADWLRHYHPYIDELARCAPRRPLAIVSINDATADFSPYELLFWGPALEQTVSITEQHICRRWPEAQLFTIYDRPGLSRVYAARIRGGDWQPSLPKHQWYSRHCGEAISTDPHHHPYPGS